MEVILLFAIALQLWTGWNLKDLVSKVRGLIGQGAAKVADVTSETKSGK